MFASKSELEEGHGKERVREVFEWTTTPEYEALNFQRQALTVDPAKACQPLGAVLCALGFEKRCLMCTVPRDASPISAPISTATLKSRWPASPTR